MKKKMHIIAIEYPFLTILIVVFMLIVLWKICEFCKVDKYYEANAIAKYDEELELYMVNLILPLEYYEGIKKNNNVIWYTDLESAVYDAEIYDIINRGSNCEVILKLDSDEYEKEKTEKVLFKLSYETESVFDRLTSKMEISAQE